MIKRILSGMRPTGKLHLGNLQGALKNWVDLQNDGCHDCFYFVADWHALTSDYSTPDQIRENSLDMVIDWLSAGLDPEKSTLFVQSAVKEHAELYLLLGMITPLSWLERNPTYKEMREELTGKDLSTYGFLGYPVLQAADIIIYKGQGVPVGVDQLPHVELTREIARRVNFLYREIFPVPDPLLTEVPKLLGIDGRKMSKSYGNSIYICDEGDELKTKVSSMFTDPQRMRRKDPGNPDICNVYSFHQLYPEDGEVAQIAVDGRTAGIGCTDCKKRLYERMLLPVPEEAETEEGEGAPREELVRQLLEYQVFKEAASALETRPVLERDVFRRGSHEGDVEGTPEDEALVEAGIFDLVAALERVIAASGSRELLEIDLEKISLADRINEIMEILAKNKSLTFHELLGEASSKRQIIYTFLAVLDLVKLRMVRAFQNESSGIIRIFLAVEE